jgi:hypothetical protein
VSYPLAVQQSAAYAALGAAGGARGRPPIPGVAALSPGGCGRVAPSVNGTAPRCGPGRRSVGRLGGAVIEKRGALAAPADTQLAEGVVEVVLDRPERDRQLFGDDSIG